MSDKKAEQPKTMAERAAEIREHVEGLHATLSSLKAESKQLSAEREYLLSAALDADDTLQFMLDYIDSRGAQYPERVGLPTIFELFVYPDRYPFGGMSRRKGLNKTEPMSLRDMDVVLSGTDDKGDAFHIFGNTRPKFVGHDADLNRATDHAWYFFFGDLIKKAIKEWFSRYYQGHIEQDKKRIGPPVRERRARIAVIDARIRSIDEEAAQISEECQSLAVATADSTAREWLSLGRVKR